MAVQAELDKTVAQLREMKLQKLELEQQLQRNAQTTSLQASQSQVQPAFCADRCALALTRTV